MIGFLLYEAADLVYTLGKLGYKSSRAAYYWYYGMEYPEIQKKIDEENEKNERIKQLEKRIEMLEINKKS